VTGHHLTVAPYSNDPCAPRGDGFDFVANLAMIFHYPEDMGAAAEQASFGDHPVVIAQRFMPAQPLQTDSQFVPSAFH
jgi:hypothetical protein